jgi:hypothetical protein
VQALDEAYGLKICWRFSFGLLRHALRLHLHLAGQNKFVKISPVHPARSSDALTLAKQVNHHGQFCNIWGTIHPYHALQKDLWCYGLLSARKPG